MRATIYHNPDCGTSRNTLAILRHVGIEPTVVEYLVTPPDRATLRRLFNEAGLTPREAARRKGTPFDEMGLGDPAVSDEAILEAMLAHPILINRPLVVTERGTRLCRPSEVVRRCIAAYGATTGDADGVGAAARPPELIYFAGTQGLDSLVGTGCILCWLRTKGASAQRPLAPSHSLPCHVLRMPMFRRRLASSLIGLSAFVLSAAAFAHPKLVSSTPADKAQGAAPAAIQLTFSEGLMPQLSGADMVMTAMPGMTMAPEKVASTVAPSADAHTLVVTPAQPLVQGSYRVDWHVVSTDTHAVKGTLSFEVK